MKRGIDVTDILKDGLWMKTRIDVRYILTWKARGRCEKGEIITGA